jgi:hypothetical protein
MDGPLPMPLFDQADLAGITHPLFPGARLVACRNPALAGERARKRLALLGSTEVALAKIAAAVTAGRLAGAGKIGIRVGKVIGRYKMAKHYTLDITDDLGRLHPQHRRHHRRRHHRADPDVARTSTPESDEPPGQQGVRPFTGYVTSG